jgi:hypothetical protein
MCAVSRSWETSIGPCRGLWLGSIPLCCGIVPSTHDVRGSCTFHCKGWGGLAVPDGQIRLSSLSRCFVFLVQAWGEILVTNGPS